MEQKQRENEEYTARKNAELEKENEKLKARLQELQLITESNPTILVLGGRRSKKMHLLNRDSTPWSTLSLNLPISLESGGAVYLDGQIYIFGGRKLKTKTFKLNQEMKWIQLTDMNKERWNISNSSVVFDGCIWVFGGWNNSEKELNSVEKYIPEENKWILMPSMEERRAFAAAAACKGKLFVSGGRNGKRALRSLECFDPANQKWTMFFLDLPSPTFGHAMISDGICLTVLGGRGEEKSVRKINPNEEEATWRNLPPMNEVRWRFTANLLGDNIFAIGRRGRSKKMEVYNGETWEDGPELPENIQDMCSIVIPAHLAAVLSSHQYTLMKRIEGEDDGKSTILVLGGYNSNKVRLLNRNRTRWNTLSLKLPTSLYYGGAACLDGEIYIFGGYELNKKTYKLNREMRWIQLADMNKERWNISNSSVVFDGCIWVFGGWFGSDLNSVEKYIPEENKWILMPSMEERRDHAAAAACKGKLFVPGGHNGYMVLRSMECFDPASQRWTMFLDLPSPTYGHAMISDGICLTVLGGRGEEKSVRKINPNEEEATWRNLPQMRKSRTFFTANLLGDKIFAIGGVGSKQVEVFNGETWKYGPDLPEEIEGMCSIVIPAHLAAAFFFLQ